MNACEFAFVCVPTPALRDGGCDTAIVEAVVSWITSDIIVICSTVEVGTTARLRRETGKRIVFQPAFTGEGPGHPFASARDVNWLIVGGPRRDTGPVVELHKRAATGDLFTRQTTAETAELCKYMENAFLALKVAFCNEMYDIAGLWDIDYNELRELWLLDPRIGRSHTMVHEDDRGFGGKCLPKDLDALIAVAERAGGTRPALLAALSATNRELRARSRLPE